MSLFFSSPDEILGLYEETKYRFSENMKEETKKNGFRVCAGASCIASGAEQVYDALVRELGENGDVRLVKTGCMGPCSRGPLVIRESDNRVYQNIKPEDVSLIISGSESEAETGVDNGNNKKSLESFFRTQQKIVLRNCGRIDPLEIKDYIATGGYTALLKVLNSMDADAVIQEIKMSGLRGRGGAGFPTWMKWDFTRKSPASRRYVLCNADEGDPGAFMDRSVLEGDPHSIIEGMAIAARAVGADTGFIYVRAEYPLAVERLGHAIGEARTSGLLGEKILGTDFSFDLHIRKGSGAFVCGEETALMHSIEGKRGEPRPRPPFPAQEGLWGMPSSLNNVETYANIAAIFLQGAEWFNQIGTAESRGTKVFALAGAVENTGLVEVPIGTSLGELIYDIGNGIKDGREFKAAQIGGPSGGCIPKANLNVSLDYESLQELGAIMGSGGLIVMDDETCMVDVARFFLEFVQEESCGKCVPCRVGTKRMLEILNRICSGRGEEEDIDRLIELGENIKETALCGLGQTAPNPVLSTIRHFRHEYKEHIRDHHCRAGVCAELVRAPCQSACPAGVDVPGFISLIAEGRYGEALKLHRERNPFAAVCARVCFHTCEDHCRRSGIDSSVAIRAIKRFMVDQEVMVQLPEIRENEQNAVKSVAIIGAGPAGLSAAYFLARLGYRPVVYESAPRPGGMLVQTIPEYRLPRETLAREIRMIEQMGVDIRTNQTLGKEFSLESLRETGIEAVFMAIGASECIDLGIENDDAPGVILAGEFLRTYNIRGSVDVGKNVVVVGGGNAAIDAARTALRLGAETVTVIYRRTREQMPAYNEEIDEALLEGVELQLLTQPTRLILDENGHVAEIECRPLSLGEFDRSGRRKPTVRETQTFSMKTDQVIAAIGQKLESKLISDGIEAEMTERGFFKINPSTGQTSVPWLFAGGDAASGPSSVVKAIAAGEQAAVGMDLYLSGEAHAFWRSEKIIDTDYDPDEEPKEYPREPVQVIEAGRRRHSFEEVERSWCEAVTRRQAQRCLRCDYGKTPKEPVVPVREELNV